MIFINHALKVKTNIVVQRLIHLHANGTFSVNSTKIIVYRRKEQKKRKVKCLITNNVTAIT